MSVPVFLWGPLAPGALLAAVAGPDLPPLSPATLPGWTTGTLADGTPALVPQTGATVEGVAAVLPEGVAARLALWHAASEGRLVTLDGALAVWLPPEEVVVSASPADLDAWRAREVPRLTLVAEEVFAHVPPLSPGSLRRQWPLMLARAEARLRAAAMPAPATRRHRPSGPGEFGWEAARPLEGAFFKLAGTRMHHRRFDGGHHEGLLREVFLGVDAALVLPYDPARDRVLLVEQFRAGPARRGDPLPWVLEPVAGLIDAGETPEEAARREGAEEGRVSFAALERMFAFYPSPGGSTDHFHCFLGLCDLPDDHATRGGLAEESEDLRLHLMPRAEAMALIATGEINAGPLIAMLYWLDRRQG